jgi:hypothetical protein
VAKGGGAEIIVDPKAPLFRGDEAGRTQNFEVVRDSGLAEVELALEVADTDLAPVTAEKIDHLQTDRMAKRFEDSGKLLGLLGGQAQIGREVAAGAARGLVITGDVDWCCRVGGGLFRHGGRSFRLININLHDKSMIVNIDNGVGAKKSPHLGGRAA